MHSIKRFKHKNSFIHRKDKIKPIIVTGAFNKMLTIKTFLDDNQIDEVHIENTGKFDDVFQFLSKKRPGIYIYKVIEPKGFENKKIVHTQKKGHRVLTAKVMELIKHSRRIQ